MEGWGEGEPTFWFEITVDVSIQMEIFERSNHFGSVEFGVVLCKTFARPGLERTEKLASHAVLFTDIRSGYKARGDSIRDREGGTHVKDEKEVVLRLEGME